MFEKALENATRRLNTLKQQHVLTDFVLIGGLAVSRWGFARATADIDFLISIGKTSLEEVADKVRGTARKGDFSDPILGVINYNVTRTKIPVQLVQLPPAWERLALENPTLQLVGTVKVPIIDWAPLVLLKMYAGGALDFQDAENIIRLNKPSAKQISALLKRASALRVSKKLKNLLDLIDKAPA
jgi:hypothetical protein